MQVRSQTTNPGSQTPEPCTLYESTRHYFAWYALNVLELPDHVVALQLGHTDGGTLVRELYGHPDAALARERIRAAFRAVPVVEALPRRESGASPRQVGA